MKYQLHVGAGQRREALTVFPIWQARTVGRTVQLAAVGSVMVEELDVPTVPKLQKSGLSGTTVLILEGDLMLGGQQNRVATGSTLVGRGQTVQIDVRCVELLRWSGDRGHETGRERASAFVRSGTDQHEIWRRVAVERETPAQPVDVSDLEPLPGQSGVLIAVGGVPVLLELFADEELLAAAWSRILQAAARDAASRPSRKATAHAAREFIAAVGDLHAVDDGAAGMGRRITARSSRVELRGIRDADRILHLSVLALGSAA